MDISFDLTGKTAVITGAAGILCGSMARHLAEKGAQVALLDLFEDRAAKIAGDIIKNGGEAIAVRVDVLDKQSIIRAKDQVLKQFGKVDILINGAGGNKKEATTGPEMSFFDMPADALQWVFDLNFAGTFLTTQVFGEFMADRKSGCIINISSMAAILPLTETVAYSAAKAAISNFTKWMAVHFNHNYSENIRVNAIAPGFLLTAQNQFLLTDEKTGGATERGKAIIEHTPMGRYGSPDELAGAVIWLASDAASFVNGIILPIDGGFSAYSGV
jgi:NAD(P)-dependent dehydrogenase (short-subunit alcohol dehydrogenase family)